MGISAVIRRNLSGRLQTDPEALVRASHRGSQDVLEQPFRIQLGKHFHRIIPQEQV